MSHKTDTDLNRLFDEIDKSFVSCFPTQLGWESAALGILLSFDNACSQQPSNIDQLKYDAMHSLRWGRNVPSIPLSTPQFDLPRQYLNDCGAAIEWGRKYGEFIGCRKRFEKGVFTIRRSSPSHMQFECDPGWFAYDVLDENLYEPPLEPADEIKHLAITIKNNIVCGFSPEMPLRDFLKSKVEDFRRLLPYAKYIFHSSTQIPSEWVFRDAEISEYQRVWDSLKLLAWMHSSLTNEWASQLTCSQKLFLWRQEDLVRFLTDVCGDLATASYLVELLVYRRDLSPPDIALQPFITLNQEWLAASSWMVATYNFERNFLALLARIGEKSFNDKSNPFAEFMACSLECWVKQKEYQAKIGLELKNSVGNISTDFDLLVWSPAEQFVLSAELKWMIKTSDLMEVLNRGEKECRDKLLNQLPKHRAALEADASGVVQRAFGEQAEVHGHDSLLVCQGFGGTSRLPTNFPTVDERVFRNAIKSHDNLRGAVAYLRSGDWIPKLEVDYKVADGVIRTPSGFEVIFPYASPLPNDSVEIYK